MPPRRWLQGLIGDNGHHSLHTAAFTATKHHEATLRKLKDLKSSGSTIPLIHDHYDMHLYDGRKSAKRHRGVPIRFLSLPFNSSLVHFLSMHRAFYLGCVMTIPTTRFVSLPAAPCIATVSKRFSDVCFLFTGLRWIFFGLKLIFGHLMSDYDEEQKRKRL